jgi:hypothetical protein
MKIEFYNELHLGDCLYQLLYCNKLAEANLNMEIIFYCQSKYFIELQLWNKFPSRIFLVPIENKTPTAINSWIGINNFHHATFADYKYVFDKQYIDFFAYLSGLANIDNPIRVSSDMLFDNEEINMPLEQYDYLIINSEPLSGQVPKNLLDYLNNELLYELNGSIITTKKIANFKCTLDSSYTLLDIAKLSVRAKYIIGVHTSPFLGCFNKFNIDKITKWYIFQNTGLTYSFNNNIISIKDINEIEKIKCE